MNECIFHLENYRFHLYNQNILVIQGWYKNNNSEEHELNFTLDGKALPFEKTVRRGIQIRQKYLPYQYGINEEIFCQVSLPEGWEKGKRLSITDSFDGQSANAATLSVAALRRDTRRLRYHFEKRWVSEGVVHMSGWVMGRNAVDITVFDGAGAPIDSQITRIHRQDVLEEYAEILQQDTSLSETDTGFRIDFPATAKHFRVHFTDHVLTADFKSTVSVSRRYSAKLSVWQKLNSYVRREGWKNTLRRIFRKLFAPGKKVEYETWRLRHQPGKTELNRQRKKQFAVPVTFSIAVPLYESGESFLKKLIESVQAQTYPHWELCIADGSGGKGSPAKTVLRPGSDNRIRYVSLPDGSDAAETANSALQMCSGNFILLSGQNDMLAPNALFECAKALQDQADIELIYADEDKMDMSGRDYFEPNFKPDFNIDYLRSFNYMGHMPVIKKDLLNRVGLMRREFAGAQEYDFILRCCEQAAAIRHIPKVLYHWRCRKEPEATGRRLKSCAPEAGCRALEDHYKRLGIPATVEDSGLYGIYHTTYRWAEQPLISILIPNKDHADDLKKCIESVAEKSTYRNYEFIVIENNSTEPETFDYYKTLEKRPDTRVVYYKGGFNYSRINNFGEQYARGDYLLLLNNDTEFISENTLWEMLGYCMREDVGLVGAKLCYDDDTIQHAGVIVGIGGVADHAFTGAARYDAGYMNRILCAQDYSAVTAACLMVKRSVYREVGGLTEEFEVAFNDTDFCLKVRGLGKLVVYNPFAELHHYESKSRGYEDTPEKIRRFNGEIARFQERWSDFLKSGDPYYNPNLSLSSSDFSLTG